jgi:hypothetical protein
MVVPFTRLLRAIGKIKMAQKWYACWKIKAKT